MKFLVQLWKVAVYYRGLVAVMTRDGLYGSYGLGASEPNLGAHQLRRLEMKFSDITLFAGTVSVVVIAALALYTLIVSFPITPAF